MRIVVVNNFYPPRVGGSAHLSDALARSYAARGHEVLVVTAAYQDAPAEEERDGVRVVRLPAYTLPESRLAVSFDLSFATRQEAVESSRRLRDRHIIVTAVGLVAGDKGIDTAQAREELMEAAARAGVRAAQLAHVVVNGYTRRSR